MAETTLLRMPVRISKREETRFSRPEMREDMVAYSWELWMDECVDGLGVWAGMIWGQGVFREVGMKE